MATHHAGSDPALLVERGSGAERRKLSVLFADLVGSTDLMEDLGPDDYAAALRGYHTICTEAIRSRGGTVAQYQGDGMMCFFGFPVVREDDACQAVLAALDMIAGLAAHNRGQEVALHTRIGIATGTAIVSLGTSHFGGETVGACLNLASRLQGQAATDRIVICEDTRELVGDRFRVRDLGRLSLKGFAEPRPGFEVAGAAAGLVSRFEARSNRNNTPRIDRETEGGVLARGFARAQQGTGYSIRVSGSAGLGKSRITRDVFADEALRGTPTFVLQCAPEYTSVPLHPVRAYLDWITGVRAGDDALARRDKLARLFTVVWQTDPDETGLLLDLLAPDAASGPPEGAETVTARRQRAFEVLSRRMFGAIGNARAFALIFEDVHWIDPTSLELLTYLLGQVRQYPLLLVATHRPEAEPALATSGFDEVLTIGPLPDRYAKDLALAAAASLGLEEGAIATIVGLAEGVPLFLEEYARLTAKQKARRSTSTIPLTLTGIVHSKLDQIDEAGRRFAKGAAIMGRHFDPALVAAVFAFDDVAVEAIMAALLAEQIVLREDDGSATFSHALIRDGIYDTLDVPNRRRGHLAAARWLAGAEARQTPAAVIADHFARGNQPDDAIDWYMKAARHAAGAGAASEAMASLRGAVEQVAKLPAGDAQVRQELAVLAMQGPVWMVLRGPGSPDFGQTQQRAHALLTQLGQASAPVLFHSALHDWARGRLTQALAHVDALDAMADGADGGALDLARKTMRGLVGWHLARNRETERLLGETVALYTAEAHAPLYATYLMEFGIFGRFYLALTKTVLGKAEEGAALARDAATLAETVGFPHAKGFAQLATFVCAMLRGDVELCRRYSEEAIGYARAQGFPEFVAMATFAKGWVAVQDGDRPNGIALMRDGWRNWDMTGFQCWQPIYAALLTLALGDDGQLDEATTIVDQAERDVEETGEVQARAPLLLARAELARARGDATAARRIATDALTVARTQGGELWAARVEAAFPEIAAT
jgi:class 3 adenylate cyclase